jgi:hypothetical protein
VLDLQKTKYEERNSSVKRKEPDTTTKQTKDGHPSDANSKRSRHHSGSNIKKVAQATRQVQHTERLYRNHTEGACWKKPINNPRRHNQPRAKFNKQSQRAQAKLRADSGKDFNATDWGEMADDKRGYYIKVEQDHLGERTTETQSIPTRRWM